MNEQLVYLKTVIEGQSNIESWKDWFARNDVALEDLLSRTEYLRLKLERIKAIPQILERFGIAYVPSDKYDWLGGKADFCRDCGSPVIREGTMTRCPNGCFIMHVTRR
jgi:hypothetical protein